MGTSVSPWVDVLPRLDPTDRALLARAGRGCRAAVKASGRGDLTNNDSIAERCVTDLRMNAHRRATGFLAVTGQTVA
jgi:hypothetical protein